MSIDQTRAEAFGFIRQLTAALKGFEGVCSTLAEEHGEMLSAMSQIKGGNAETRKALYPKLRDELIAHMRAEEASFYPPLAEDLATRALARRAIQDHQRIRAQLELVDATSMDHRRWLSTFRPLSQLVERHHWWEENELFPRAVEALANRSLVRLDDRYRASKRAALKELPS